MDITPRFDLFYEPVGPSPAVGKVTITLRVHVEFRDFTRGMMRRPEFRGKKHKWTKEQLKDFAFPSDEKKKWVGKFAKAVRDGWGKKHKFALRDPAFASHRATCDVEVEHVEDPGQAHTVVYAQWVPRGAPRLRSVVSGGFDDTKTALLDARDPDEPVTFDRAQRKQLIRQLGSFDHNSADINSEVRAGIDEFKRRFRRLREPGGPFAVSVDKISFGFTGRATSPGSAAYNSDLALRRAGVVADRISEELGLQPQISLSVGESNASTDAKFRRVDVTASVSPHGKVSQNVAAHEAGHMFGFGDEYVEEDAHKKGFRQKFQGDQPQHDDQQDQHQDVKDTVGEDAAEEMLVHDSPSIMSRGSEVTPGHYTYFLQSLNSITSKGWVVE